MLKLSMKMAVLSVLILLTISCSSLREFFGQDPFGGSYSVCPQIPILDDPKLNTIEYDAVVTTETAENKLILSEKMWLNITNNHINLLNWLSLQKKILAEYNKEYSTEVTLISE